MTRVLSARRISRVWTVCVIGGRGTGATYRQALSAATGFSNNGEV